jgi:hypothetical protein
MKRRPGSDGRPLRRRGYRHAVLTDARARPLVYADTVSIIPSHPGGSVGLAGAAFAPGVLERLSEGIPTLCIRSGHRLRLVLHGVRVSFHAGEQRQPEGGWHVQAAVGTYRTLRAP